MNQSSSPPPSAVRQIPVFATMRGAYATVFGALGLLVRAAALPFMLSLVVAVLSFTGGQNAFLSLILLVAGFVPYTLFGVAWHRLSLLGPGRGDPEVFPAWRERHWRFFAYAIVVTGAFYLLWLPVLVTFGSMGPAAGVSAGAVGTTVLLVVAITVMVVYVTMRLSFVFPAVAVDETYTLRDSWVHTRGQALRLFAALLVTALPVMIAFMIVGSMVSGAMLAGAGPASAPEVSPETAVSDFVRANAGPLFFMQVVQVVIGYILAALMVSAISIAFRIATGWVPAPTGRPPLPHGGGAA